MGIKENIFGINFIEKGIYHLSDNFIISSSQKMLSFRIKNCPSYLLPSFREKTFLKPYLSKLLVLDWNNWYHLHDHHDVPTAWISLTTHPNRSSLLMSPLEGTQCPNRADECKFLPGQLKLVCPCRESIRECRLWVHLYFPTSAQQVFLLFLGWFVRWEVSGRTTVIL